MSAGRRYGLTITLRSPLLLGGRRTRLDDNPSTDVVSGAVMRAAVAQAILAECPYPGTDAYPPRWVAYRDREACPACRWRGWCRSFGQLTFEHLAPAASAVLPLTARRCKDRPREHGLRDSLLEILRALEAGDGAPRWECPACPGGAGRTEQVRGLQAPAGGGWEALRLARTRSVRTAMDPVRQRAADGRLYSVTPILPWQRRGERWERQAFVGAVHAPAPLEPLDGRDVALGARTTSGYGDVEVRMAEGEAPDDAQAAVARVRTLNERLDALLAGRPRAHLWLAVDLQTEAVVPARALEASAELPAPARLRHLLLDPLAPPPQLEVDHAWLDWSPWRGWDTREHVARRKSPVLRLHAGSVLVLRAPRAAEAEVLAWVAAASSGPLGLRLGAETADGFGRARCTHPFHLAGTEGSS